MSGAQLIVLATPVFFLLIGIELAVGHARGRNTYRLNDALSSIGLGIMSQIVGLFTKALGLALYVFVFDHAALAHLSAKSPWTWLAALVAYDFLYYWYHRFGHTVALLWAAHVVHHQSEDYNLSTALRQTSSGWIVAAVFYLPLAVAGFPPAVVGAVVLIDLLYQFWVHTEHVGRLGWFDRWFCAPSNHRVHHAVNDAYLDRNYGGIFIVWDRLFGTYAEEDDAVPCVYGTRGPLASWNPVRANLQVYAALVHDSWHTRRVADKLRVWFMPPHWRPADVAVRFPRPPFVLATVARFETTPSPRARWLALLLFVALLAAATLLLWHAGHLSTGQQIGAALAIVAGLWAVGRLSEGPAISGDAEENDGEHRRGGERDRDREKGGGDVFEAGMHGKVPFG